MFLHVLMVLTFLAIFVLVISHSLLCVVGLVRRRGELTSLDVCFSLGLWVFLFISNSLLWTHGSIWRQAIFPLGSGLTFSVFNLNQRQRIWKWVTLVCSALLSLFMIVQATELALADLCTFTPKPKLGVTYFVGISQTKGWQTMSQDELGELIARRYPNGVPMYAESQWHTPWSGVYRIRRETDVDALLAYLSRWNTKRGAASQLAR